MGTMQGNEVYPPTDSKGMKRSEAVRVRLLGTFSVSVGSRTISENEWRLRKAAALVKLLTLASGHRLHREQTMDLLWPKLGRKAASNNLRRVLHVARRTLDPAAGSRYLASEDESLVLCPIGELWVDVEAFEKATVTARRSRDPAAYKAAVELYAGDLLPGDRYEQWTEDRREELRQLHLALLLELAGLYEERDERVPAVEVLRRTIAEEPTLEEAHAGLMRLYALSNRRAQAIAQYERLQEILSRQLGAEPSIATRSLRDEIAAGRIGLTQPAGPPLEESPDSGKHNLPASRTSFVGREHEMVGINRMLAMTRLLSLTGAGGSGKTRLALEVARGLVGSYPDGVWLAELAPISEGELVPQAVAQALSVREQPGRPLTDTLAEDLRAKSVLLILDNCEHLADSVAHLLDTLLDSCPRLRVLATSREALGVAGETVWRVPPSPYLTLIICQRWES
jgi:DNA-binding SARP family transcriptional activator